MSKDKLYMAGIDYHTKIAAPFVTTEIFVQGCNRRPLCDGCWNEKLWDISKAEYEFKPADLADILIKHVDYKKLTIGGGEPMFQAGPLSKLASILKENGFFIMSYTGWKWEDLFNPYSLKMSIEDIYNFLRHVDVLIDGPYIKEKRSSTIGEDFEWIGSMNQRIIDVQKSLQNYKVVSLTESEVESLVG